MPHSQELRQSPPQGQRPISSASWPTGWDSVPGRVTECAVSGRSRRGQQVLCSLSCDRGCKTLALILEGISWTLGDVPEWQHPNSSYISLSGGPHVFSRPPVYSTLFLILLDQHDVIAVLHQCDVPQTVQMVQISWDYILAAGERVIKALEQN